MKPQLLPVSLIPPTTRIEFSQAWKQFLNKHDIPYMHMKEFAHSTGSFARFKNDENARQSCISDALGIIEKMGCISFATVIDSQAFNKVITENNLIQYFGNAYLMAARTCTSDVSAWCENLKANQAEYILEAGDERQDSLRHLMKHEELPEPILREKTAQDPECSILPLQAADFLAYELGKFFRDLKNTVRYRYPLKEFERMTHRWGIYEEGNIQDLIRVNAVVRQFDKRMGSYDGPVVNPFNKE